MRTLSSRLRALLFWEFSPGSDASGVIVSEKGVGQRRIFRRRSAARLGVGWRGASGGGVFREEEKPPRLDMQIVFTVTGSPVRRKIDNDRAGLGAEPRAGTAGTAKEAVTFVPSFENMYQSRAASDRDEPDAGDAESNPRKQGDTDNEK